MISENIALQFSQNGIAVPVLGFIGVVKWILLHFEPLIQNIWSDQKEGRSASKMAHSDVTAQAILSSEAQRRQDPGTM